LNHKQSPVGGKAKELKKGGESREEKKETAGVLGERSENFHRRRGARTGKDTQI